MNVVEAILYQCQSKPFVGAIALPGSGDAVKYGELERLINNAAAFALHAGLAPGQVAALYAPETVTHMVAALGLMRIGVATVSLEKPALPVSFEIDAIMTSDTQQFSKHENVIPFDATKLEGDGKPLDGVQAPVDDDICRVVLTSESKGVAVSHRLMMNRIAQRGRISGALASPASRLFCGFGPASEPGFDYWLQTLIHGGKIYFPTADPSAAVQFFDAFKMNYWVTPPHALSSYVELFEADPGLDSNFAKVISEGRAVSYEAIERARRSVCQNIDVAYGSPETSTIAYGSSNITERVPGAVGFVCPGVSIEVVGSAGQKLPPGKEGEILVCSPLVANGYLGDAEAATRSFADGVFSGGDRGFVTDEGLLVITEPATPLRPSEIRR